VTKNAYPYPPDEFDSVDPSSRPKEVHAARRGAWSRVWPFIVVIVVVPAIALGVVKYLSSWSGDKTDPTGAPTNTVEITQTVTDPPPPTDAVVEPPADTGESQSPEEPVQEPVEEPEETPEPPPLDRDTAVQVLNAKGEAGLAGRARGVLTGDGWTDVEAGDYTGGNPGGSSAVYYAKKSQATSAQTVADMLRIDAVKRDKDQSGNGAITVVLRSDFVLS
jgi:type IV secretory pathway VirB10-like protein